MALLKALFRVLVVAVLLSPFCVQARPMGGKFGVESIYSNGSAEIKVRRKDQEFDTRCLEILSSSLSSSSLSSSLSPGPII